MVACPPQICYVATLSFAANINIIAGYSQAMKSNEIQAISINTVYTQNAP